MQRFMAFQRDRLGVEKPALITADSDGEWYDVDEVDTEIARLLDERDGWEASSKAWEGKAARLQRERDALMAWPLRFGTTDVESVAERMSTLQRDLAAANARADEAKRLAIWSVRNGVEYIMPPIGSQIRVRRNCRWDAPVRPCDGTDADIYRALRDAMGGEGGGSDGA